MAKTEQQRAHSLLSHYEGRYRDKYGRKPKMNRVSAKWNMIDVLTDLGESETYQLIDFYFKTTSATSHSLNWFFYNYDKLAESKSERDRDALERMRLMEESRERAREWNEKNGNARSGIN